MAEPGEPIPPEGIFTPPEPVHVWQSTCTLCGKDMRFAYSTAEPPSDEIRCTYCGDLITDWSEVDIEPAPE